MHRDTYDAVKLLNSRLIALGQDACSSLHAQSLHGNRDDVLRDDASKVDEQTAGACNVIDDVPFVANPIRPAVKPRDTSQFNTQLNNAGDDLAKQILDNYNPESAQPVRSKLASRFRLNDAPPRITSEAVEYTIRKPIPVNDSYHAPHLGNEYDGHDGNHHPLNVENRISVQPNTEYGRSSFDTFS